MYRYVDGWTFSDFIVYLYVVMWIISGLTSYIVCVVYTSNIYISWWVFYERYSVAVVLKSRSGGWIEADV